MSQAKVLVALALVLAGCSTTGSAPPDPSTVATSGPHPSTTSVPPPDTPSQTPVDASRDGIFGEFASLPSDQRINLFTYSDAAQFDTEEGTWMISVPDLGQFPDLENVCLLGDTSGVRGLDYLDLCEYGEILLLDETTGEILRAYPFQSVQPWELVLTDNAVYCYRQGDGALPDSMLCRIDRLTGTATVRVFPSDSDSAFRQDTEHWVPPNWTLDDGPAYVVFGHLEATTDGLVANGWEGTVLIDPEDLVIIDFVGKNTSQPSQTPADAIRDGVVPEMAALSRRMRVDLGAFEPIATPEGLWAVSRPRSEIYGLTDGCGLGDPHGLYGRDIICTAEYGEVLLLSPEAPHEILRAYPLPGLPPQNLVVTDDAVYCSRQGDGALTSSMLCRIDRTSGDWIVRVFPYDADSSLDSYQWIPPNWTIEPPAEMVVWQTLSAATDGLFVEGQDGRARVDPITLEILEFEPEG